MKTLRIIAATSIVLLTLEGCRNTCSYRFLSDLRAIIHEHNEMVNATTQSEKIAKHELKERACNKFWKNHGGKQFSSCLAVQKYETIKITPKFVEDACSADVTTTNTLVESTHVDS